MVPVIDAIAAASSAFRDQEGILRRERHSELTKPGSGFRQSGLALSETAEKLLFNIGRIPVRQSREADLPAANGKSCRRAEKVAVAGPP
jgi:hypothetical protein